MIARPLTPFAVLLFALAIVAAGPIAPVPLASASPTPSASPLSAASPSPAASPTPMPTPTILMLPPDAAPQILWYSMSSTAPHPGDLVVGIVLTSSNVASVELRISGFSINLPKTGVGRFEGSYRVPNLPFFISHRLTVRIIARNTAGTAAEGQFQMQIR